MKNHHPQLASSREFKIMVALVLVLLVSLIALGYLVLQKSDQLATWQRDTDQLDANRAALARFRAWQEESQPEIDHLNSGIVTSDNLPNLIERLEQLATSTKLTNFSLDNALVTEEVVPRLEIGFSAKGSLSNILTYLTWLKNQPEKMVLTRVNLVQKANVWSVDGALELWSYNAKK